MHLRDRFDNDVSVALVRTNKIIATCIIYHVITAFYTM